LQKRERYGIDLARRKTGLSGVRTICIAIEVRVDGVGDPLRTALVGQVGWHSDERASVGCVCDSRALVGSEEKHFVANDRTTQGAAEAVVVKRRALLSQLDDGRVVVAEERRSVHFVGLKVFVHLPVIIVGAGFGELGDMRAEVGAL
jgi:hypothetical protein